MSGTSDSYGRRSLRFLVVLGAIGIWGVATAGDDVKSAGRKLFLAGATPACAVCHTLADAGSTGNIGPSLDELKPNGARVEKAVREGLGIMPANKNLSDAQIKLLAQYVAGATGGAAK